MIHRALFGSIERFFGILIEHFVGKFPLWLSPLQVRILTVADRHAEYAKEVCAKIKQAGLLCDVDDSSESINKKVRNAQLMQINYILTVGDKESENKSIAVRTRDNVLHGEISISTFVDILMEEKNSKSLASRFKSEVSHA
jgi:threonyl-tRNA synthetase